MSEQITMMDRCKLFSKLTRSNDEKCMLFEELLKSFFEEYTSLYGGLLHGGIVDDITDISCRGNIDKVLKVSVSFDHVTIDNSLVKNLKSFIKKTDKHLIVSISPDGSDTLLIDISKG